MAFGRRIDRWSYSIHAYLLAGRSAARCLAALGLADDSLWPFLEADRRLREAVAGLPPAAHPLYLNVLAALVAKPDRVDAMREDTTGSPPAPVDAALPLRARAHSASSQFSAPAPAGGQQREMAVPGRQPGPRAAPAQSAQDGVAPISSGFPAGLSRVTRATLQQFAGKSRSESLPDRGQSRPVPAFRLPATSAGSRPFPATPLPRAASAVLFEQIEQRLSGQGWSASQAAARHQDGGKYLAGELLSALVRRAYAQPVVKAEVSQALLAHLASRDAGLERGIGYPTKIGDEGFSSLPGEPPSPVSPSTRPAVPAVPIGPTPAGALLRDLVGNWSPPGRAPVASPMPAVVPVDGSTGAEEIPAGSPAIRNTFNVTVHTVDGLAAGGPGDEQELANRIARILADQARRYGIDIK